MIKKEDPKVSSDELALVKVEAWTWYQRGSGFEQTALSEYDHIVTKPSMFKRETMEKAQENISASTHHLPKSLSRTSHVGSSLLDAYEIERISKDLDRYIKSSCDQYYRRKSVDVVCDPSGRRIVSSRLERDSRGTKDNRTSKETKWFGFRVIYKLCASIEGGVVENVQFPALDQGRDLIRQIGNTRIGDCWLKANVARFTLEEGEIRPEPEIPTKKNMKETEILRGDRPTVQASSSFIFGNRSFTDTLLGRQGTLNVGKSVAVGDQMNAFQGLHGKALVARMTDLEALKSTFLIMDDLSPGSCKVQYIGGLSVLVSFEDNNVATVVCKAAREMGGRFSSVDLWEGQVFCYERLAWLKLMGIPLHLISGEVFEAVGNAFGKKKMVFPAKRYGDVNAETGTSENANSGGDEMEVEKVVTEIETADMEDSIDGIDIQINVEEVTGQTETFGDCISGNLFNFDNGGQHDVDVEETGPVIHKRKKKSMLGTVGRPNPAYSSSLEKTKAGKKPKGNEDVFGLDPLIGIESECAGEDHGNRELDSLDDSADFVTPTHVDEIEATINLGGKLGANLITAHELILDSIVNEGLQGGKL
ncbi:hypothetical protein L1987_18532 [Smallanthus sonchifolius]|uniref:Uncharacterized protein n=1 Tax=Smallanthus sonchifolius TaxID=185202 RepID=A0ACB9J117_9ASTR|nr:hypothetical protein L1987_18532 [Smallanthus sonchifolius]